MFLTSCILLCFTVAASNQEAFTYIKPWDPFRRSATECEMCYKADCVTTTGPRCEYYAEASKLMSDEEEIDDKIEDEKQDNDKIDTMLFEFVNSASLISNNKGCIPFVSQYTDCTEENICTGCKFCTCSREGKWICIEKQICRPEPKLTIDHRVIDMVIENLRKKERTHNKRVKRSDGNLKTITDKELSYTDLSKWMYGVEPFNYEQKKIDMGEILDYFKDNQSKVNERKDNSQASIFKILVNGSPSIADAAIPKNDTHIDSLEFNDLLESRTTKEAINAGKSFKLIDTLQTLPNHHFEEPQSVNDVEYTEYDPIRLIKRDTSKLKINDTETILQINTTSNNYTFKVILTDALQGLNKITIEKQEELEELMNIQNNLLKIANTHNIVIDIKNSSTDTRDNYNKHHIAIYKLDTIDNCVTKTKHDICSAIGDTMETDTLSNSNDLQRDLKIIFSTIRKYIFRADNEDLDEKVNKLLSQEHYENPGKHIELDNISRNINPITYMDNILSEINKAQINPLRTLSYNVKKILKRIIKQLYLDDFAVIDFIVHETYYDFDSYLENIGTKWNKMMQDIVDSEVFDTLYRIKLLHVTLKADISKMEDMITLLDFARNRRMTIANGVTIDKSILRIQDNLKVIDSNVQQIIQLEKNKKLRQASIPESKPAKKKSIIQKLKKIFQSSKKDIKDMLRKRFPKSEIIKQIAKKKIDDLERQKMLDYQETMKQWEDNLGVVSVREKRSSWGFRAFTDRIKSIIPGYLRGKVKPRMQKKTGNNNTHKPKTKGGKKERRTKSTTIKTTTISRILVET